jgi:hypothetical protein
MCENMDVYEVCAVSEVLCSVFDEENGRRALATYVSHTRKTETCASSHRRQKEMVNIGRVSHLPNSTKKTANRIFYRGCSLHLEASRGAQVV